MSTPLTDSINALTTYANEVTGGSDTNLSDAVHTLASGYGGSATLITKTITANGTYSASDDSADGYSEVTVNVPSSAASSWTKVAETSYQVSTTSTSTIDVATITCSQSIWTAEKIVYVKVRDTEGKRSGYFYGTDTFIINMSGNKQNIVYSDMARWIWRYGGYSYSLRQSTATTVYGVAAGGSISSSSPYNIIIQARYSSSYSGTINGTYKVEVYLLDPAGGVPIFE